LTGHGPVLVTGPDGDALAEALAARGHEVRRTGDPGEAGMLVTVAPRVQLRPFADLEPDEWLATFGAWAEEPFFAAQGYLQGAYERGRGGCWVAVTSVVGTQPFVGAGGAGTCAVALQTLVRIAAIEGGRRGVRANAVAAGWRRDDFPAELDPDLAVSDTPRQRLATPDDIAAAVAWLLSDEAAHVTGEVLRVDGGYTITRGARPDPARR
jgi:NAD(P)-dependent dehydrogenase (short-subunit alcohol dehydrogenase family)